MSSSKSQTRALMTRIDAERKRCNHLEGGVAKLRKQRAALQEKHRKERLRRIQAQDRLKQLDPSGTLSARHDIVHTPQEFVGASVRPGGVVGSKRAVQMPILQEGQVLAVAIPSAELRGGTFQHHAYYTIHVTHSELGSWTCSKRFSEFEALRKELATLDASALKDLLPLTQERIKPAAPTLAQQEVGLIETRRIGLNSFLQQLTSSEKWLSTVTKFLQCSKNQPYASSSNQQHNNDNNTNSSSSNNNNSSSSNNNNSSSSNNNNSSSSNNSNNNNNSRTNDDTATTITTRAEYRTAAATTREESDDVTGHAGRRNWGPDD